MFYFYFIIHVNFEHILMYPFCYVFPPVPPAPSIGFPPSFTRGCSSHGAERVLFGVVVVRLCFVLFVLPFVCVCVCVLFNFVLPYVILSFTFDSFCQVIGIVSFECVCACVVSSLSSFPVRRLVFRVQSNCSFNSIGNYKQSGIVFFLKKVKCVFCFIFVCFFLLHSVSSTRFGLLMVLFQAPAPLLFMGGIISF